MAKSTPVRTKSKPQLGPAALAAVAARFRLLGDPTRLALIQALMSGERTVGELVEQVGTSQANASKQLAALSTGGVLRRRKDGVFVYYEIADESVRELCQLVCGALARQHEEAQRLLG